MTRATLRAKAHAARFGGPGLDTLCPMLLTERKAVPREAGWLYEIKFDGYPSGRLMLYGQSPHPVEVTDRFVAIGSGGMAAMASIETQVRQGLEPDLQLAMKVACDVDQATGPPIVSTTFAD